MILLHRKKEYDHSLLLYGHIIIWPCSLHNKWHLCIEDQNNLQSSMPFMEKCNDYLAFALLAIKITDTIISAKAVRKLATKL